MWLKIVVLSDVIITIVAVVIVVIVVACSYCCCCYCCCYCSREVLLLTRVGLSRRLDYIFDLSALLM